MKSKDVENLSIWLAIALVLGLIAELASGYYFQSVLGSVNAPSDVLGPSTDIIRFSNYAKVISAASIHLIIGVWLYRVAPSRKLVWAFVGVSVKWWALALYVLYDYLKKREHANT